MRKLSTSRANRRRRECASQASSVAEEAEWREKRVEVRGGESALLPWAAWGWVVIVRAVSEKEGVLWVEEGWEWMLWAVVVVMEEDFVSGPELGWRVGEGLRERGKLLIKGSAVRGVMGMLGREERSRSWVGEVIVGGGGGKAPLGVAVVFLERWRERILSLAKSERGIVN